MLMATSRHATAHTTYQVRYFLSNTEKREYNNKKEVKTKNNGVNGVHELFDFIGEVKASIGILLWPGNIQQSNLYNICFIYGFTVLSKQDIAAYNGPNSCEIGHSN